MTETEQTEGASNRLWQRTNRADIAVAQRLDYIALKAQSGNKVPVGRISLTLEEWGFLLNLAKKGLQEVV